MCRNIVFDSMQKTKVWTLLSLVQTVLPMLLLVLCLSVPKASYFCVLMFFVFVCGHSSRPYMSFVFFVRLRKTDFDRNTLDCKSIAVTKPSHELLSMTYFALGG